MEAENWTARGFTEKQSRKLVKNGNYWKGRFQALEDKQYKLGQEFYDRLQKDYQQAVDTIEKDLSKWYLRLANNNNISYHEAKKFLSSAELKEFKWSVEQYIKAGEENAVGQQWMKELENASAKTHVQKLEAIKLQLQQHVEVLYGGMEDKVSSYLNQAYTEGFYQSAFEIAKGTGVGHNLAKLDSRKIDTVIKKPWAADGKNFSDRIWEDKDKLTNSLHAELVQNVIRGEDPQKAINSLSKRMGTSKSNSGRLIMTETAAISAIAQEDCYRELGVEQFEVVATLDSITSDICQKMDGQVFDMADYKVGETVPPYHPWCRSVTIPYFDDEFSGGGERAARDPETGKTVYVPADMKYPEWKKQFVGGQGGLHGVSENVIKVASNEPIILEKVDLNDPQMVQSVLSKYENLIVKSDIENAIVITANGDVKQCIGTLNSVDPVKYLGAELKDAIVTHNHPLGSANEYSFSARDITLFMDSSLKILRGVDENFSYELNRDPANIDDMVDLFDMDETGKDYRHNKVIDIATELKIGYRRWLRE